MGEGAETVDLPDDSVYGKLQSVLTARSLHLLLCLDWETFEMG